jgi:glycosyltransferase involved in cell wall biosynthesis
VSPEVLRCADEILQSADHVIAISPFLARMGKHRYGDKFSALPLGIDTSLFCPPAEKNRGRMRVVSAGRIELHKRPELFLTMAENFPQADFIWYGEGSLRHALLEEARSRKLENVSFPGSLLPSQLADEFRRADLFVMPSKSEGVPKVTQEAAACGLPMVLFGFFEAPSVINGDNGFVVWDDNEFFERVSTLVGSPGLCEVMGKRGAQMSLAWSWEVVAPQWEAEILNRFVQLKQLNGYEK